MKRYCNKSLSFLFFCLAFFVTQNSFGSIKCRGNSSFIKVSSGANFVVNQPISNFNGKLIKKSGGTLSGQNITFVDGLLADTFNNVSLSSILNPSGFLSMTGSHTLRGIDGTVLQAVQVTGTSNRIEGSPQFNSDVTIVNSNANLTMAMQSTMNRNIALNGGTLLLGDNLKFVDSMMITGSGTVSTSGYELEIAGKDIIWTSTLTWSDPSRITLNGNVDFSGVFTFAGTGRIIGNGNIFTLRPTSSLVVTSGATLFLDDIMLKGLGGAGGSLVLQSNSASVVMSNVGVQLSGNITTTIGGITVKGPGTWTVQGNTWLFDQVASLTVDGITLWKDQAGSPTAGTIAFTSLSNNRAFLNNGTISSVPTSAATDSLSTSTGFLQSQIDRLGSCCDTVRTSTGFLQSQIDVLRSTDNLIKTSTGSLQSQVDSLSTMQSMLKTSTGYLQSQVDVLGGMEAPLLQSQIDQLSSMQSMLKTSTGYLQSQIDSIPGVDAMLKTSTGFLQSQIDSIVLSVDLLGTTTSYLSSQITVVGSQLVSYTYQIQLEDAEVLATFNRINGGFKLSDSSTTVTVSTPFPVMGVVDLNGGTLVLANDLLLTNISEFVGSGTVIGNGHVIDFSPSVTALGGSFVFQDVILNLKADLVIPDTVHIKGCSVINAGGHFINLSSGSILVDSNSCLTISSAVVTNILGTNIACKDNTGKIILNDLFWLQDGNVQFIYGGLQFKEHVLMKGSTFAYQSSQTCTVMSHSTLFLDEQFTFSYDPSVSSKKLFVFEDDTAALKLNSATLHATGTGLELTNGSIHVAGNAFMSSELGYTGTIVTYDAGITFGDETIANDCSLNIAPGSQLQVAHGSINYKNVSDLSFVMGTVGSKIVMAPNTTINLYETLNLGSGFLVLGDGVVIGRAPNVELIGSIQPLGSYYYVDL